MDGTIKVRLENGGVGVYERMLFGVAPPLRTDPVSESEALRESSGFLRFYRFPMRGR